MPERTKHHIRFTTLPGAIRAIRHALSILTLTAVFCIAPAVAAEQPVFYLEVSPKSGSMDDKFIMSVVVEGSADNSAPLLRGGDDFKITSTGPRSEIQIINGRVKAKVAYIYNLIPRREGQLTTPSAEIQIGGQSYAASPLKISVRPSSAPPDERNRPYFLKQSVDSATVFTGQQLVSTLELWSSTRLAQPRMEDLSYDDFWTQPLGANQQEQRVVDGVRFDVLSIRRSLFPLRPGSIELPSRKVEARVLVRSQRRTGFDDLDPMAGNFFAGFFDSSSFEEKVIRSNALGIRVNPLPEVPAGFETWGMSLPPVGATRMAVTLSADAIKVGDSKTLLVEIYSFGNLGPLNSIALDLGPSLRLYPETPETRYLEKNRLLVTQKSFRISLVPLVPGKVTIPALSLAYFDPADSSWKKAESRPISFEVAPQPGAAAPPPVAAASGRETSAPAAPSSPGQTRELPGEPPLKFAEESVLERISAQVSPGLALLILSFSALLVFALYKITAWCITLHRSSRSWKALKGAVGLETLHVAVQQRIISALKLPPASEGESLKCLVRKTTADDGRQYSILNLLDEIESCRFGPHPSDQGEFERLRQKALAALKDLD